MGVIKGAYEAKDGKEGTRENIKREYSLDVLQGLLGHRLQCCTPDNMYKKEFVIGQELMV